MERKIRFYSHVIFAEQIDFMSGLPYKYQQQLELYSSPYYQTFRQNLINQQPTKKDLELIQSINYIFETIPPITFDIYVFKGIPEHKAFDLQIIPYVSTSLEQHVAKDFLENDCCLYEILIPKGTKCIPLFPYSQFPYEFEIVLSNVLGQINIVNDRFINFGNDYVVQLDSVYQQF